LVVEGRRLG